MSDQAIQSARACEHAGQTLEELERNAFYMRALFEASHEVKSIWGPKKILETFLLTAMGPLGITRGVAVFFAANGADAVLAARGLETAEMSGLQKGLPALCTRLSQEFGELAESEPLRVLSIAHLPDPGLLPHDIESVLLYSMEGGYGGFLGFGRKIAGEGINENDLALLRHLTDTLTSALHRSVSTRSMQQLHSDLLKKNRELYDALQKAESAREELDRRIFHLKTLSDLNVELSPICHTRQLLESFLLVTMGSIGIRHGYAAVYDRETKTVHTASRGIVKDWEPGPEEVENLLFKAFDSSEGRTLRPMSRTWIMSPEVLNEPGIEPEASGGIFFVVDQNYMGLVGFGPTLSGNPFSEEERELLLTHTGSFQVFLSNTHAFEKIQNLNNDLARRNLELQQTIKELTEARYTIVVLERAKAHIKGLIQREMERVARATRLDFLLIILMAACIGSLFNYANPQGIPLLPDIMFRAPAASVDVDEAKRLIDSGEAILVDARPKEFYDQKHIKGAVNVPLALFDIIYMMKLSQEDLARPVIVYGRNISKHFDEEVSFRLKLKDHDDVRVLSGGLKTWEARGYEVE